MGVLIDKQTAIDVINEECDYLEKIGGGFAFAQGLRSAIPTLDTIPSEDCDTCKHGYYGDEMCINCRVRYPSHYERKENETD